MKKILNKILSCIRVIFGYGIISCLFIGGILFIGYLMALFIGGEVAGDICTFIYKTLYPIIIYASGILVLLGLVAMYFSGETALVLDKNKKSKEKK